MEIEYNPNTDIKVFTYLVDRLEKLKGQIEEAVTRSLEEAGVFDEYVMPEEEQEIMSEIQEVYQATLEKIQEEVKAEIIESEDQELPQENVEGQD